MGESQYRRVGARVASLDDCGVLGRVLEFSEISRKVHSDITPFLPQ